MLTKTSRGMPSASTRRIRSGANFQRGVPMRVLAGRGGVGLGQGEGGNAEHGALDGAGDGTGIGHVLGGVAAAIDAREHQVGLAVGNDVPRADDHAVGRRALDGEVARPDLAQPQRIIERERMRHAGLVGLRRHHPDVIGQSAGDLFEHLEPAGMHAVVIGDENAHGARISLAANSRAVNLLAAIDLDAAHVDCSASGTAIEPSAC